MAEPKHLASGARPPASTVRVIDLAARQEGVIARWQLENCGLTPARLSRWVAAGRLHRLLPTVYAVGHPGVSDRGHLIAALLYSGRGAALSHGTGAWWVGLMEEPPGRIHICSPSRRRSSADVIVHRSTAVARRFHLGLPVLVTPSLLLQLAATERFSRLRKILGEADFLKLLDERAIRAALGRGRPGSAVLKHALGSHLPQLAKTVNDFEADFVLLCESAGLPLPEPNARVSRFRPDMLWREHDLIVELDGRDAHTRPAQVAGDHRRDLQLRALGYEVIRYTWEQVTREPAAVVADLRRRLATGNR